MLIAFQRIFSWTGDKGSETISFGSVSRVVNYFVILDYAFLVGLYLLLIRKILFQMANAKRKCTFTNLMQEKHPCFRKGRNDYEAECLVCKSGTYISVVHKGNGNLNTHTSAIGKTSQSSKKGCCINESDKLFCYSWKQMQR